MWNSAVTRQRLQKNINRLRELNEVPGPPKENLLAVDVDSKRRLSVERECEIASNLAFLSAISDDCHRVMAVCFEEHPSGIATTIRIASNSGDLLEVSNGFKMIAAVLEQAARRENIKSEDLNALLQQVVHLDTDRILSRLRSRHAKRSKKTVGKQPVITQLNQAIFDKSVKTGKGLAKNRLTTIRDGARTLEFLFTRLESILDLHAEELEVQKVLREIVQEAYELTKENDLSTAFQRFSGDPSLKKHLPEAIGKLGRYYSATCELICAARDRKCGIFQNVKVETFQTAIPISVEDKNWKVHAEIQLLFFYELHPDLPRPRIICSSKSACYLCDAFFRFHGGFQIPRTHGRLYEKWILPDWLDVPLERRQDLGIALTKLNRILENKIQEVWRSGRRYVHPNESVLLPLAHWSSSSIAYTHRSMSTIRSKASLEGKPRSRLSTQVPLTPPKTPPESIHVTHLSRSDGEHTAATDTASLINTHGENPQILDTVSLIAVGYDQLPYRQLIAATTPSLHVQLDGVSLILEFIQVFSGHLLIAQAENAAARSKGCQVVDITDIPTATELQLNCRDTSNELTIQLQNHGKGIIRFKFVWDN